MITGRSASRRSAAARATSGTGPPDDSATQPPRGSGGSGRRLGEHDVHREVDEGGPGVRRDGRGQRLVDERRDLGRRLGRRRQLGQRPHEGHVVELLQRALAPAHRRGTAAEDEHRRAVLLRRGDRAHPVRHAGAGGQRSHAGLSGDLGPALGGEGGGRLVAHVDEVDALLAAAVVDREQMPAGQREELGHAVRLEALGHQPPPVELRGLLGLGAHRAGPYRQMSRPCRSRLWDPGRPRTMRS